MNSIFKFQQELQVVNIRLYCDLPALYSQALDKHTFRHGFFSPTINYPPHWERIPTVLQLFDNISRNSLYTYFSRFPAFKKGQNDLKLLLNVCNDE